MKQSKFFGDQTVLPSDLENIANSYGKEIKTSRQSLLGTSGGITIPGAGGGYATIGGVYGSVSDRSLDKNLKVNAVQDGIQIFPGKCIDDNGEVAVLSSPITIFIGQGEVVNIDGDKAFWSDISDGTYYVKARYISIESEGKTDDAGTTYYTRVDGIIYITIDKNVPISGDILLATFNINLTIIDTIIDARTYTRTYSTADAISINPINSPFAEEVNVEDHITSIGSGTATPNNPHGLTASDINANFSDEGTDHRLYEHVNGVSILSNSISAKASYKVDISTQGAIKFEPPLDDSYLLVGGSRITTALSQLNPITISNATGDGSYYIVVDSLGVTSAVLQSTMPVDSRYRNTRRDSNVTILASLNIDNNGALVNNLVDMRIFHAYSPLDVSMDVIEGEASNLDVLLSDSLIENLNRIRLQVSKSLTGVAGGWGSAPYLFSGSLVNIGKHHHDATAEDVFKVHYNGGTLETTKYYGFAIHRSGPGWPGLIYDKGTQTWHAAESIPSGLLISNGPPTYANFNANNIIVNNITASDLDVGNVDAVSVKSNIIQTLDTKNNNTTYNNVQYRHLASHYARYGFSYLATTGAGIMTLIFASGISDNSGNTQDIETGVNLPGGVYNWVDPADSTKFYVPVDGMYEVYVDLKLSSDNPTPGGSWGYTLAIKNSLGNVYVDNSSAYLNPTTTTDHTYRLTFMVLLNKSTWYQWLLTVPTTVSTGAYSSFGLKLLEKI